MNKRKDGKSMRMLLIFGAATALAAVTADADTTRSPDASATSAAVSVNTTSGDSMVSQPGSVDTRPRGMVLTIH